MTVRRPNSKLDGSSPEPFPLLTQVPKEPPLQHMHMLGGSLAAFSRGGSLVCLIMQMANHHSCTRHPPRTFSTHRRVGSSRRLHTCCCSRASNGLLAAAWCDQSGSGEGGGEDARGWRIPGWTRFNSLQGGSAAAGAAAAAAASRCSATVHVHTLRFGFMELNFSDRKESHSPVAAPVRSSEDTTTLLQSIPSSEVLPSNHQDRAAAAAAAAGGSGAAAELRSNTSFTGSQLDPMGLQVGCRGTTDPSLAQFPTWSRPNPLSRSVWPSAPRTPAGGEAIRRSHSRCRRSRD